MKLNIRRFGHRGLTVLQWALIAVAAVLLLSGLFFLGQMSYGMMRGYGVSFFPFGFGVFGGFGLLILFAIPIVLLWPANERNVISQRDDALEILRQRYAKGEITKEQFDQMTRDLTQKG